MRRLIASLLAAPLPLLWVAAGIAPLAPSPTPSRRRSSSPATVGAGPTR